MTCCFSEAHAECILCKYQGRDFSLGAYVKYAFHTGLRSDAYEPISFKLGMIIDTTTSLKDLDLHLRPQGCENGEFVQSFCCKVA